MTAQENPGGWPDAETVRVLRELVYGLADIGRFNAATTRALIECADLLQSMNDQHAALVEAARADGAEAMREAAAVEILTSMALYADDADTGEEWAGKIRALPVPPTTQRAGGSEP
jgi:hypothetical protein